VAAPAGNLYFFFAGIATGIAAVFLIVRDHAAAELVRTMLRYFFIGHLLLLLALQVNGAFAQ